MKIILKICKQNPPYNCSKIRMIFTTRGRIWGCNLIAFAILPGIADSKSPHSRSGIESVNLHFHIRSFGNCRQIDRNREIKDVTDLGSRSGILSRSQIEENIAHRCASLKDFEYVLHLQKTIDYIWIFLQLS